MTVVYVDSVFILNAVMDYLLCLVTARLAGIPLRRRRYLLAALAGGAYAVAAFLPGCGFLSTTPVKLVAGVLMALVAYGSEERFLRLMLLFFAISCGMAGCVLAFGLLAGSTVPMVNGIFYTDVNVNVLLIAAAAVYVVLTVVFRAAARQGIGGTILPVRVCIGDQTVSMTALWDSGNSLRDPTGGRPVLVVAPGGLDDVLPQTVWKMLTPENLRFPSSLLESIMKTMPELHPRLLPYHAVGMTNGLLLALQTDWVEINGIRYSGIMAALSPTTLGAGYMALWGGEVRRGGWYERSGKHREMAAEPTGAYKADSLYWRQRYASASAEQGEGNRAAEPRGR